MVSVPVQETLFNERTLFGYLNISESYQLPDALMSALLDDDRRDELLDIVKEGPAGSRTDPFRDYFQEKHSNREKMMQDFTPDCLCKLIAGLAPGKGDMLDLCSGTGALSLFVAPRDSMLRCEELSTRCLPMLLANLALKNRRALVVNRNVVTRETFAAYRLEPGDRFSTITESSSPPGGTFDVIVSNPPFSLKWNATADERTRGFDVPPKKAADWLFVLDGLNRLNDDGTMLFILPLGVLFRTGSEQRIRREIVERGYLRTIIGLPDKLFMNTGIPVCVLVFRKNEDSDGVLFVDASKCFEKNGKTNIMSEAHISRILEACENRRDIDRFAHLAPIGQIRDNDWNLNIPRYVDTFEYEEPPSLTDCVNDLMSIDHDIAQVEEQLASELLLLTGTAHGVDYQRDMKNFIGYLRRRSHEPSRPVNRESA